MATLPGSEGGERPPKRDGADEDLGATSLEGRVIARRYRLQGLLGRGGQGEVWRAHDSATGEEVAIKLIPYSHREAARIRREAAALRFLRLPGVVTLRDEGLDGARVFLVMDLAQGTPFPGILTPCSWGALRLPAAGLLEALARVHAAGVVHRDIKPANVLIAEDGRPTLLDFGLSRFLSARGDDLTTAEDMLGTPAYLAPEQLRGDPVTARTDLYSTGVVLYEALSGRLPHEASEWRTLLRARLTRAPAPLREIAPSVPAEVARAIDAMLAVRPEDRPESAIDALSLLAGHSPAEAPWMPWIGPTTDLELAFEALANGASIDIAAPPGSGRTRLVLEIAHRLASAGFTAHVLAPASLPFGSLEPALGEEGSSGNDLGVSLAEKIERVESALDRLFARRAVLLTDDAAALDPLSAEVLHGARGRGPVLRIAGEHSSPGAVRKQPITARDLESLFAGPNRLFHLREDAAARLFERSGGSMRRAASELSAWVRAGVARKDGAGFRVDRESLDALEEGFVVSASPAPESAPEAALPRWVAEVAAWAAVAGDPVVPEEVARAANVPLWRAEAALADLTRRGLGISAEDRPWHGAPASRKVRLGGAIRADHVWSEARVSEAHGRFAAQQRPGAARRLYHLLRSGATSTDVVVEEAVAAATARASEGQLRAATGILEEAARILRSDTVLDDEARSRLDVSLWATWLDVAMADGAPATLDHLLYAMERARGSGGSMERFMALARAGLAQALDPRRAVDLAGEIGPFEDPRVERLRLGLLVSAARSGELALEEAMFATADAWASGQSGAGVESWRASCRGRLLYRRGRFEEAAREHARAAETTPSRAESVLQRVHMAAALLEAFQHEQARVAAESALAELTGLRSPVLEARAEWALRTALYRMGRAGAADLELVEAAQALALPYLAPLIALTEAAAAFRTGDLDTARSLARKAASTWEAAGIQPEMALLGEALSVACGGPAGDATRARVAGAARRCRILGVGAQVLGLLGMRWPGEVRISAAEWAELVSPVPVIHRGARIDVLSVGEAESCVIVVNAPAP